MKKIEAIVKPYKVDAIMNQLLQIELLTEKNL
jgi:nitrogen regulatory protein PII